MKRHDSTLAWHRVSGGSATCDICGLNAFVSMTSDQQSSNSYMFLLTTGEITSRIRAPQNVPLTYSNSSAAATFPRYANFSSKASLNLAWPTSVTANRLRRVGHQPVESAINQGQTNQPTYSHTCPTANENGATRGQGGRTGARRVIPSLSLFRRLPSVPGQRKSWATLGKHPGKHTSGQYVFAG